MSFEDDARNLPTYRLSDEAKARHRDMLLNLPDGVKSVSTTPGVPDALTVRRSARRKGLIVAVTAVALTVGGLGTAAALGVFSEKPTDRSIAYCHATADVDGPHAQFSVAGSADDARPGDSAVAALSICKKEWGTGAVRGQEPYLVRDVDLNLPPTFPVPELMACVLPQGQVAVMPGGATVCAQLGLANADL